MRIVPMHAPQRVTVSGAKLTYGGGPLLTAVEVFTVFWGQAWQDVGNVALVGGLNNFYTTILSSPMIDRLAEYSVPGAAIGHGRLIGTTTVADVPIGARVSENNVVAMLRKKITAGTLPENGANTLYCVYLPSGVVATLGSDSSCGAAGGSGFCGYHDATADGLYYAIMAYPDCAGCKAGGSGLSVLESLTEVSSHELCEAITDPVPGKGWYDGANGEIGDICNWQYHTIDGYTVQVEWSNQRNVCG
jgi:hypothetical protein